MRNSYPEINRNLNEQSRKKFQLFGEMERKYCFPLDAEGERKESEERVAIYDFLVIPRQSRRKLSE